MRNLVFTLLSCLLILSAGHSGAQLVSCNAFLQGNHVELGINWMGAFGSAVPPPSGYHPQGPTSTGLFNGVSCGGTTTSSTNLLGFVADPNLTNWTAYFGDYYMPGFPQEGWALEIKGHKVLAYTPAAQTADSVRGLSGSNISHSITATGQTSTWEGIFDSVKVTQVTTVDTGALFITVNVTLTNLAASGRDSVYYLRTIDPDNDQTLSTSYNTKNKIDHQMPGGPDSLVSVSAKGKIFTAAQLALATKDYRAHCFIMDVGLNPTYSLKDIYNDSTTYYHNLGDSSGSDVGIGLVFNIGHLATVDSAADSVTHAKHPANTNSFKFIYSFKSAKVSDYLNGVYDLNVSDINANNAADITVYPNPTSSVFQIAGLDDDQRIELYDMTGRVITDQISILRSNRVASLSDIPKGNYLLIIRQSSGDVIFRQILVKI